MTVTTKRGSVYKLGEAFLTKNKSQIWNFTLKNDGRQF